MKKFFVEIEGITKRDGRCFTERYEVFADSHERAKDMVRSRTKLRDICWNQVSEWPIVEEFCRRIGRTEM